ncbi:MAG: FAD-dependent oxidoreductase, partial [Chloroflexota bacterium]
TVGRITDPHQAEQIIAEGHADMVGMTRAHIADPELVTKLQENRVDDIRPCVGANNCIRNAMSGSGVRCIHNPEAGREAEIKPPIPTQQAKRVVIIGGGPAGLEAARVSALRGHRVDLFERSQELGGQLRLWANAPAATEFQKIVAWQERQLHKLDVTLHLNREVTAEHIKMLGADVVIIATGSHPHQIDLPGSDESSIKIVTPHAVVTGETELVSKAVLWDEGGGHAGLSAAETLLSQGTHVEILSSAFAVADDIFMVNRVPLYQRLMGAGAILTPNSKVVRVVDSNVIVCNIYSEGETTIEAVDLLVTWHGNRAIETLSVQLKDHIAELHTIGDSLAPRSVETAIAEGSQVGRTI